MRAAVCLPGERISVEEWPQPRLEPGDVLVRVHAVSICATDLKIARRGHFKIPPGTRRILGHEIAGEIVEVRAPESTVRAGLRVGLVPNVGCGRCSACVLGLDSLCPDYDALGITLDGGFAEFVRVPARAVQRGHVVPLPEEVTFEEAALAEPLSCVLNAHEAVATGPADRVLILGAGPMGLLNTLVARVRGAGEVVVADPWPQRREAALGVGADQALPPEAVPELGDGFDVVIVTAPDPRAQEQAIRAAGVRGRVNFFAGFPSERASPVLDTNRVHYRQLLLTGTTGQTVAHYRRALRLLPRLRPYLARLVTDRRPLEEVAAAMEAMTAKRSLKAMLFPGDLQERG
ncbi:MAG: alcohol dehydrogenase catalytic domain-containing protein [Armatimonadota bacterium]|nr:alcohol dehydrogenase catalytic domain-containing protein [Armatimonadota bacterium]MDR7563422.1 alcohol dehydrogenase catalytic domain-containing protein [Armatimonadota bacterium]MDR7568884.1 alcohol dehydrogenase catalytic domain-containing protein [Armatimonadota bacterium]